MAIFYLKLYLITLAAFLAIDMLWLGLIARGLYSQHLGFLLNPRVNWIAAILFYLLFVAGLIFFVVAPGLREFSLIRTLAMGAFFGLLTYATYDLTNLATIRGWPVVITVIDILWGMTLATLVTLVSYSAGKWLS